jgi:hypothetical protein
MNSDALYTVDFEDMVNHICQNALSASPVPRHTPTRSFKDVVDQLCITLPSSSRSPSVLASSSALAAMPSFYNVVDHLCKEPLHSISPSPGLASSSSSSSSSFKSFHDLLERLHQFSDTHSLSIPGPVTSDRPGSQTPPSSNAFLDLVQGYSKLYKTTYGSDDSESSSGTGSGISPSDLDQEHEPLHPSGEDEGQTPEPISREHVAS